MTSSDLPGPESDIAGSARSGKKPRAKGARGQSTRAAFRAVKQLLAQKRYDDALTAIAALPDHDAQDSDLTSARLKALEQTGRVEELTQALEDLFGPLQADLEQMLRDLPLERWDSPKLKRMAEAFYSLDANRPMSLEAYQRQYVWGHVAASLLGALTRRTTTEPTIQNLVRQAKTIGRPFDDTPLIAAERAGRSILVTRTHGGISAVLSRALITGSVSLPQVRLTRGAPASGSKTNFSTRENSQANFLKIVKQVKKSPHQMLIFPDAGDGGEFRTFELLGREVKLRMGAATLAWYGKAATFFVGARWQDGRPHTFLAEGPIADGSNREEFEDAFCRFYLERIETLACGPPEDIVMRQGGGIWNALLKGRKF